MRNLKGLGWAWAWSANGTKPDRMHVGKVVSSSGHTCKETVAGRREEGPGSHGCRIEGPCNSKCAKGVSGGEEKLHGVLLALPHLPIPCHVSCEGPKSYHYDGAEDIRPDHERVHG